jgi:transcriptional regulator with XRE-family HTH domain
MLIGQRIRSLREHKGLSQGDIENVSGMLRCYISRVEHGHTVPSVETLQRFAAALDVPLYQLFYEEGDLTTPNLSPRKSLQEVSEEEHGPESQFFSKLKWLTTRMVEADRAFLLDFAKKLATR